MHDMSMFTLATATHSRSLCRRRLRHRIALLLLGLVVLDRQLDRVLGEPGRVGGKAC